jgi:hypothetical protein
MGIVINQATWGDEASATDITDSLQKQAAAGYLNTKADNTLVPAVDLLGSNTTVKLSNQEKADIEKQAVEICGSESDRKCIAFQKNQLESSTLQGKVAEKQSSANMITGRRLTLTYTDSDSGVKRTVAIPDGQSVKFGTPPTLKLPTLGGTALTIVTWVGALLATVLYAFSVAITYRMLALAGQTTVAYGLTALAIVVPYSGLITTPIALAAFKYMDSQKVAATV